MLLTAVGGCLAPLVSVCDPTDLPAIALQAPAGSSPLTGKVSSASAMDIWRREAACGGVHASSQAAAARIRVCVKRMLVNAVSRTEVHRPSV
jgi:hypothetical protein